MSKIIFKSVMFSILVLFVGLAHADLKYPGDCTASKIIKAAKKGGCTVEMGAKHQVPNVSKYQNIRQPLIEVPLIE